MPGFKPPLSLAGACETGAQAWPADLRNASFWKLDRLLFHGSHSGTSCASLLSNMARYVANSCGTGGVQGSTISRQHAVGLGRVLI
jgi:hypothetical protein